MNLTAKLEKLSWINRILLGALTFWLLRIFSLETSGFQNGPILCLFRNLTGLPCPFCGTTRSIGSILQGKFETALALNPLGFLVIALAIILVLRPKESSSTSKTIAIAWWKLRHRSQYILILALISTLWILNLPRIL